MRTILSLLLVALVANAQTTVSPALQTPEEIVLQFIVEAGKTECFYQDITNPKHVSFEVDYQVTEGGDNDINFMVKNPRQVQVTYDAKKREGNHRIDILDNGYGAWTFCFDNSFSYQANKHVFFEIFLLDKDGGFLNNYDTFNNKDLAAPILGFERITNKIKNDMNQVEKLQAQLRAVESRDRSIMETNFERVNFWSTVHLIFILVILGTQLFLVRSLFIENSKVGRVLRKGRLND